MNCAEKGLQTQAKSRKTKGNTDDKFCQLQMSKQPLPRKNRTEKWPLSGNQMQIEEDYFVNCKKFIKANNELEIKIWQ